MHWASKESEVEGELYALYNAYVCVASYHKMKKYTIKYQDKPNMHGKIYQYAYLLLCDNIYIKVWHDDMPE